MQKKNFINIFLKKKFNITQNIENNQFYQIYIHSFQK